MRTILAVLVSILFFPIALVASFVIGLASIPEIMTELFMEVRGK